MICSNNIYSKHWCLANEEFFFKIMFPIRTFCMLQEETCYFSWEEVSLQLHNYRKAFNYLWIGYPDNVLKLPMVTNLVNKLVCTWSKWKALDRVEWGKKGEEIYVADPYWLGVGHKARFGFTWWTKKQC